MNKLSRLINDAVATGASQPNGVSVRHTRTHSQGHKQRAQASKRARTHTHRFNIMAMIFTVSHLGTEAVTLKRTMTDVIIVS